MPENLRMAVEHLPLLLGVVRPDGSISFKALGLMLTAAALIATGGVFIVNGMLSARDVKIDYAYAQMTKGARFTHEDGVRLEQKIIANEIAISTVYGQLMHISEDLKEIKEGMK